MTFFYTQYVFFNYLQMPSHPCQGMDTSYHVSVTMSINSGISIHNIHKGVVYFSLVCTFK